MKKVIILGTSPSLTDFSHEFLSKFTTIGCNQSYEYYESDYHVLNDTSYSIKGNYYYKHKEFEDMIRLSKSTLYLKKNYKEFIEEHYPDKKDIIYYAQDSDTSKSPISKDPLVFKGNYSVSHICLNLAYALGAENILTAGVQYYPHGHFNDDLVTYPESETTNEILDLFSKYPEHLSKEGISCFRLDKSSMIEWPYLSMEEALEL